MQDTLKNNLLVTLEFSPLSLQNSGHLPSEICLFVRLFIFLSSRTSLHEWAWSRMLESRTQPRALTEKHQELFGSLGRDTVSCCGVGTWATTPNPTLWSRTEQLKPGQKRIWHILGSLEGIRPSSLKLREVGNFYSQSGEEVGLKVTPPLLCWW